MNAPFIAPDKTGVAHAAGLLRAGEIVAVPSETVYGLAADALDTRAVRKIFEAKGRPLIDPLIVHVADFAQAELLARFTPDAKKLAAKAWPGPLTLVLEKDAVVPDLVTAGEPTVALRMPAHPVFRALIAACGRPLAAPSANPFGYVSPTTARHVRDSLGERAPHIIDGGPCDHGVESTVLSLVDPDAPRILRPGPVTAAMIEAILGKPVFSAPASSDQKAAQASPGMLERHYSPNTPVRLFPAGGEPGVVGDNIAVAHLARPGRSEFGAEHFWFSENGDPAEVAKNLFSLIRHLDTQKFSLLLIESSPPGGLGDAINDRLTRAAAGR